MSEMDLEYPKANTEKYGIIHTLFKSAIHAAANLIIIPLDSYAIKDIDQLKSSQLRKLWVAWDMGFDRWERECDHAGYRQSKTYDMMLKARNIAFTIIDNDYAYMTLLGNICNAYVEVQADSKLWKKR
jgi:hypothetical protein